MSPKQFLRLSRIPEVWSEKGLSDLRRCAAERIIIDLPFLVVDLPRSVVTRHEGRHRAKIAAELGMIAIPVMVIYEENRNFVDLRGRVAIPDHTSLRPA